eukprot:13876905-Alexandrium_andersonii.AAC.1
MEVRSPDELRESGRLPAPLGQPSPMRPNWRPRRRAASEGPSPCWPSLVPGSCSRLGPSPRQVRP